MTEVSVMNNEAIQEFEPGVFIELDDVISGVRKLARVTTTGRSYEDLDDADSTPFPIYQQLAPVEVGNILGWGLYLVDQYPDEQPAFKSLVDKLIASGHGSLVYNRAAHWAFHNHSYDYDLALHTSLTATSAIRNGRARMDRIIGVVG